MNNKILILIGAIILIAGVALGSTGNFPGAGGIVPSTMKSANASSSAMTIGPDVSLQVLAERSRRNYTSVCLDSRADSSIYLVQTSSAVTASSSNTLVQIEAGECFEQFRPNVYGDVIHAIGLDATSTDILFVTEYFD